MISPEDLDQWEKLINDCGFTATVQEAMPRLIAAHRKALAVIKVGRSRQKGAHLGDPSQCKWCKAIAEFYGEI